jgi:hypothetical protein
MQSNDIDPAAKTFGVTRVMHNRFSCAHNGVPEAGPPGVWIADTPLGRCTRNACPLAQSGAEIVPDDVDRARLPGYALLACLTCLEEGRQPHSHQNRICAVDRPHCLAPSCSGMLHVCVVTAHADIDAWMELGARRRESRAPKPRPAVSAIEAIYTGPYDGDAAPYAPHNLFRCTHGGRGQASEWIADSTSCVCKRPDCRRRLAPTPTPRDELTGFALLTCRACLVAGRQPNSVKMDVKTSDKLLCARGDCSGALQIRAIVAWGDVDRWLAAGRRWLIERGAAEAAAKAARLAALQAQHETVITACAKLDSLDDIYAAVQRARLPTDAVTRIAAEWLADSHTRWSKRHPEATERLAALLSTPASQFETKCAFCGVENLFAGGIGVRICGDVRAHLLASGPLTTGCQEGSCCETTACRACAGGGPATEQRARAEARQRRTQAAGLAELIPNPTKASA